MFGRPGQSTLTPEAPRRRNRKGLSSSGHNLNSLGQQKNYDRDALAFNHYLGYLKQPLRRHLSSDITYLVPSMPGQFNDKSITSKQRQQQQPSQLVNYDFNKSPPKPPPPPPLQGVQYDQLSRKTPEPIYSAPRRQRSFRKQRSLDNPTNDNNQAKSSLNDPSNSGLPNDPPVTIGFLSEAMSFPHLPVQKQRLLLNQPPSPQDQPKTSSDRPHKPAHSVSTEGLIQHIISQQSQIERLSKQQDFLTQQLITRDSVDSANASSYRRSGRSRARSISTSKSQPDNESISSLEPVKRRSSSREKIQEQLHAQQAKVQKHIKQLEAQLEMIRDIRTGSSRSHSRATSVLSGSKGAKLQEEEQHEDRDLKRPLSADPRLLKSPSNHNHQQLASKLEDKSKQSKVSKDKSVLSRSEMKKLADERDSVTDLLTGGQSLFKPKLILTNPSEDSKDEDSSMADSLAERKSGLIVNRPGLPDQDDGIPFMDDELMNDEPPDGNESDELETVFEFDRSTNSTGKRSHNTYGEEEEEMDAGQDYDDEEEEEEDWEDEELEDCYSRDRRSPQAESDPWSRLMEEDILRAREEMDRQRELMERQEVDLTDQRQQLISNEILPDRIQKSPSNQQIAQNLIQPSSHSQSSLLSHPLVLVNQQSTPSSSNSYYENQGNRFNFNDENFMETEQSQSGLILDNQLSNLMMGQQFNQMDHQQQRVSSPNHMRQSSDLINLNQRLSPNLEINQQQQLQQQQLQQQRPLSPQLRSSFSPVINSRSRSDVSNESELAVGDRNRVGLPKLVDRQISTPIGTNVINQTRNPTSPNTNYIKRPSIEDQLTEPFVQLSIVRSKMLPSPSNLSSANQFNQPSVPPRRKSITPRTQSPIQMLSSAVAPSYRIQTNKNRMAGQQIITTTPKRPQRLISQLDQPQQPQQPLQQKSRRLPSPQPQPPSLPSRQQQHKYINQQHPQPQQQQQQHHQYINQQQYNQPSISSNLIPLVNQQSFNQPSLPRRSPSPQLYSPKPTTLLPTVGTTIQQSVQINRPESMFRPIGNSNQMHTLTTNAATPIIKIDPAKSLSNLNLSYQPPSPLPSSSSFNTNNQPQQQFRRSPSPQPQPQLQPPVLPSKQQQQQQQPSLSPTPSSSASSFLKRAGSFIQRNTNFKNKNSSKKHDKQNQKQQQQQQLLLQQQRSRQSSPSPTPITSAPSITISSQLSPAFNYNNQSNQQYGNTLKIDLQSIRSNRSSRASSPAPPTFKPEPRKTFISKDTVEAGSYTDHLNQYYAPQSGTPKRRPLSQQFSHSSTGEINKIGRSVTPNREIGSTITGHNRTGQFMDTQSLKRTPSARSNQKLNNIQSTANALIDAPIHSERRQTLPEITKSVGIEDMISAKEDAVLRNLASKKKQSLPQDDLHEVPPIPGWEREKVATLAHEAREARMNQRTGAVVHLTAATNYLIKFKFMGLIILFNAILVYLFMRLLEPVNDQVNELDDQSKSM